MTPDEQDRQVKMVAAALRGESLCEMCSHHGQRFTNEGTEFNYCEGDLNVPYPDCFWHMY